MIWHIFKKDWRLLWRFSAGFGVMNFVLIATMLAIGRFNAPLFPQVMTISGYRSPLTDLLPLVTLLGGVFLIMTIVHQEAIPGVRQDWLVRPIQRRDLLFAKLLSVLVLVQGPILAADLTEALLAGFSVQQSMHAALARSIYLLFSFSLPVLAFASLTKNLMEAIVGGTAIFVARSILNLVVPVGSFFGIELPRNWIDTTIRVGILLLGACVLLGFQYSHRKTMLARWLMAAVVLIYTFAPPVPMDAAFAIEQRLAPAADIGNRVTISFEPNREGLEDRKMGPSDSAGLGYVFVLFPIRITGIPDEAVLNGDFSKARLITPDGESYDLGQQNGFRRWNEYPGAGNSLINYGIRVPQDVYRRFEDQPLRVEIDYSLTLLRLADSQILAATGGDERTKDLGWCGTRVDEVGLQVLFGCIEAGQQPSCVSLILEHKPSGARNPFVSFCRPDYSPYRYRFGPDALGRFTASLPFANPSSADLYPVKASMLAESQVRARAYKPQGHFVRQLVIPQIRLREWATD